MITAGLAMSAIVFGDLLLKYWLNNDIATNAAKAIPILGVTYFILSIFSFLNTFLSGRNMLKMLGSTLLVMTVLDLGAMIFFIPRMGVLGASIAYACGTLPVFVLLYIIEAKFWEGSLNSFFRFYVPVFAQMGVITGIIGLVSYIFLRPLVINLFLVIMFGGGIFAVYLAAYVLCGFLPKQERDSLIHFFKSKLLGLRSKKYV
jgi:O-antigen/teichoic acid export membrane protein